MAAISRGCPKRPIGVRESTFSRNALSLMTPSSSGVSMVPGPTALTRMPCGASAIAIALVSWLMPPLESGEATGAGRRSADRDRLGERADPALGDRVGDMVGQREALVDGAHVDDGAGL